VAIVSPAAWLFLARGTAPSDATSTYPSSWDGGVPLFDDPARDPELVSCSEPLGRDDVITRVDGRDLAGWSTPREYVRGDRLRVAWRADEDEECTATLVLGDYPWAHLLRSHLFVFPLVVVMWALGTFVFFQRPREPAARALFAMGALLPWGGTAWPFATQLVDVLQGRHWPFLGGDIPNALLWGSVLHFVLVFPRPVPWLERRKFRVLLVYALPFVIYGGHVVARSLWSRSWPDPTSIDDLAVLLSISRPSALTVPFLLSAVIVWQYKHADAPDDRRRVRWVMVTLLASAAVYIGLGQGPDLVNREQVPYDFQTVAFLLVPFALAVAVLQYGIFDLRVLLRRSLLYGALTSLLVLVPVAAGVAVLLGVDEAPSWSDPTTWNVVLATCLVIVVSVWTLRAPLSRRIGRLVFGTRDDPFALVGQLGSQLRTKAPADDLLTSIAEIVAQALRLPFVAIEVTDSDGTVESRAYGAARGEVQAIDLLGHGEVVGRLLLGSRPRTEPFGHADQQLLELLAQQVGLAAKNVLLTTQLQRSLERAVSTREEERRRLRRDIHDGLGPMLAAVRMRLEVAGQMLATNPDEVAELLTDLARTQQLVIDDVQRLVENLRPPVLDQLGLEHAVRERAAALSSPRSDGTGFRVVVETAGDLDSLPAGVEVATYRIALEALTNAARHSGSTYCRVRITRNGAVEIVVTDDGVGVPATHRAGVGLGSMRERASEVGGTCTIEPGSPTGTVVRARLPLATT
jgi:signal transduction histidine kinase